LKFTNLICLDVYPRNVIMMPKTHKSETRQNPEIAEDPAITGVIISDIKDLNYLGPEERRVYLANERRLLKYERFLREIGLRHRTCPGCENTTNFFYLEETNQSVCSICGLALKGQVKGGQQLTPIEIARLKRANDQAYERLKQMEAIRNSHQDVSLLSELDQAILPEKHIRTREPKLIPIKVGDSVFHVTLETYEALRTRKYPKEPTKRKSRTDPEVYEKFLRTALKRD